MNDDGITYELPYEPGKRFRVSQGYGGPFSHTGNSHYSIDFSMPEGTPVCAARGGVVYRVVDSFSEGGPDVSFKPKANTIHILHPDDTLAAYVHLLNRGSVVTAGQAVVAGQLIGYSGNTGWSREPHLHFHVADAVTRERIPTKFRSKEAGTSIVGSGSQYTRPKNGSKEVSPTPCHPTDPYVTQARNPFAFSAELLALAQELKGGLSDAGFEVGTDYSSIDALHDVHGLEVCGIRDSATTLEVTRVLLRAFPSWNAGWIHPPEHSSQQNWLATIQRDSDPLPEYWDTD